MEMNKSILWKNNYETIPPVNVAAVSTHTAVLQAHTTESGHFFDAELAV